MKLIVAAAVIALAFTTGFTCSRNAPQTEEQPTVTPAQEVPAEAPPADMPAEGAAPTEGANQ